MVLDYCLTYFRVMYDENFDMKDFCERLSLDYEYLKNYGTDCSLEIGRNEIFNININEMLRETLKDLFSKEEILLELKEKYNLEYYLERVPELHSDTTLVNPVLSLDHDIIEFLYKTKTIDDLDYFIY
jgi:hypothetical protein